MSLEKLISHEQYVYLKFCQEKNGKGGNGERDAVIRRNRLSYNVHFWKYKENKYLKNVTAVSYL